MLTAAFGTSWHVRRGPTWFVAGSRARRCLPESPLPRLSSAERRGCRLHPGLSGTVCCWCPCPPKRVHLWENSLSKWHCFSSALSPVSLPLRYFMPILSLCCVIVISPWELMAQSAILYRSWLLGGGQRVPLLSRVCVAEVWGRACARGLGAARNLLGKH